MINRVFQPQITSLRGTGILVTSRPHRAKTRRQAFRFAFHGLQDAWKTQPNLRLQVFLGLGVIAAGLLCHLALIEWLWVSFAIGFVIFAELMNTTIEQAVDLVVGLRPDSLARRVKDISAACVLTAALLASVIGALAFGQHLVHG